MAIDKAAIKEAVSDVLDDKLGSFFIEREQHYQDHCFVREVRDGMEKARGTTCKTLLIAVITGSLSLLVWGFLWWVKKVHP